MVFLGIGVAQSDRVSALPVLLLLLALCGCAELRFGSVSYARPFRFDEDTFIFANELVWAYSTEPDGTWAAEARKPEPDYSHQCFVLARSARQFFQHARFDPTQPEPDEDRLRALIRRVAATSPRLRVADDERVVIPGFASLRSFSRAHAPLLQQELGGWVWSYVQRGNWRLVLPFTRRHQADTARRLVEGLERNLPPIVHLVRFPHITINHAVLVFGYTETEREISFSVYDPNAPEHAVPLSYDKSTRTFELPRNGYFRGGRVDVYEIYHRPWY
jgi:hypothetical protein